ncbi:MAG: hypothetical protein ACOYYJ_01525 [Chloroflexota bacterium]
MKTGNKRPKRPMAVSIVAWAIVVLFLVRLYQVFEPLVQTGVFEHGITAPLANGLRLTALGNAVLTSASYALLSLAGLVVLAGFLRMRKWAWVTLMVWTSVSLTTTLIDYFYRQPNYVVMASDVIITFALNQSDVQRIFGIRTDQGEPLD